MTADFFATHFAFMSSPEGWAALVTLVVMEVVLGIDNLIFISILTNKLPAEHRQRARRLGIGAALIMRLLLLATISWIVGLTQPVFTPSDTASVARPDPDRRRPVPDLEGDQGDPPRRPVDYKDAMVGHAITIASAGRSSRSCCSTSSSRSTRSSPRSA